MKVQSTIEQRLRQALPLEHLEILDESHNHSRGSETHFKITAVSPAFDGLGAVKRHQRLYELLTTEMQSGVHALALHTYTPAEWERRNASVPRSPECAGGAH
jgi:BolA protein